MPYPRADWAEYVMTSLLVDKELSDVINRTIEVEGNVLVACVLFAVLRTALFPEHSP